jgi:hypothetical protein
VVLTTAASTTRAAWRVDLDPVRVPLALAGLSVLLAVLAVPAGSPALGTQTRRVLLTDSEGSVGAWFNSAQLGLVAALCASIAVATAPRALRWRWWLLAGLSVAMSVDETVAVHEVLAFRLGRAVDAGSTSEVWVLPALLMVLVLGVVLLPLLRRLPRRTVAALAIGVGIYLAGALGLEYVSGELASGPLGRDALSYRLVAVAEELGESLGLAVVIAALAGYQRGRDRHEHPAWG